MTLIERLSKWWDEFTDRSRFSQSVWYWHKRGALMPYAAAAEERALRLRLEEFRNFASRRWLEDRTLSIDDIKQEWLDLVVKPMAKIELCRDQAKALKAAIASMPASEIFVGLAAKARKEYVDEAVADAKAQSASIWKQQRERALKI